MNEKSELLNQLKIDRSASPAPAGIKLWQLIVAILITVGVTLWLSQRMITPQTSTNQQNASTKNTLPEAGPATTTPPSTTAAKPVEQNDTILNASGYITARRMATVSAEIMGLITQVNVEEGMEVEEGQVLATLDDSLASVSLQLAQAQVEVLRARRAGIVASLDEARRVQKRFETNQFSSEAQITSAQARVLEWDANLKSTDADIAVAKLEVSRQQERLADHTIRAPFAGVVTVKNAQPGEIVAPTSAGGGFTRTGICTIVDMASLEIEVDVNESFIGRVYSGQRVEARLDAYPDWIIPASVIAIIPTADRAKATVQVRINIEVSDQRILPDMGVKVSFLKA